MILCLHHHWTIQMFKSFKDILQGENQLISPLSKDGDFEWLWIIIDESAGFVVNEPFLFLSRHQSTGSLSFQVKVQCPAPTPKPTLTLHQRGNHTTLVVLQKYINTHLTQGVWHWIQDYFGYCFFLASTSSCVYGSLCSA